MGRLEEERVRVDGAWLSTTYEYDLNGRSVAILRPNGMATRWAYRDSGEVASIRHELDWTDPVESDSEVQVDYLDARRIAIRDTVHGQVPEQFFYDSAGLVDEIEFPGGEKLTYTYDARGRIDTKEFVRPDSTVLRTFGYQYDLANRLTSVEEDGTELTAATITNGQLDTMVLGNGGG